MKNPHVEKVGGTSFNVLFVDEWLVGIFKTNNDIWRFLEYLGWQLTEGEPVPAEIYVFTVAVTGLRETPISVLESAKIVKVELPLNAPENKRKPKLVYTALHDEEAYAVQARVLEEAPQIMDTLFP